MRAGETVEPVGKVEITIHGVGDFVGAGSGAVEGSGAVGGDCAGDFEFDWFENVFVNAELGGC